jgi:hypothetical protein
MRAENWPDGISGSGCGCARCRDVRRVDRLAKASLSAALAHAQNRVEDEAFEAATAAGTLTLPGRFEGWRGAVTLDVLFGPSPPSLFTQPKPRLLYRIYIEGRQKPLYIGMAYSASIRERVTSHLRGIITKAGVSAKTARVGKLAQTPKTALGGLASEIQKLRVLAAQLGLGQRIKVQHAAVTPSGGQPLDPKLLHAFESTLQVLERPHSYVGTARTFELEDAF